jgi:putative ABC transport system ATP-binding protein
MTAFVKITGVRLAYAMGERSVVALDGVDLEIPKGQFLCVRGRSGSGKSSLLHVVGGLRRPSAGSVRVGAVEVTGLDPGKAALFRRRKCGVVFQFFNLLDMLTVTENVAFPLGLDGVGRREINARVAALLEELGLAHRRDHFPDQLSGGEQQRVAIARALAIRPDLILADEPTGNLDSESGIQTWMLLRDVAREHGVTTLMVTHDPDATAYVDRVVELSDGRVVGDSEALSSTGHGGPA